MKRQHSLTRGLLAALGAIALAAALAAAPARATTLAYWRFGDDPAGTTPANGDWITPTAGRTIVEIDPAPAIPPAYILGRDSSGNGNSLYTWDNDFTGHNYRTFTSSASSLRTGATNNYSIQNSGGFPASFTWSLRSSPTLNIEPVTPLAWTIEASIYKTSNTFHQTFVGRDGNGVGGDAALAPLYFKTIDGNLQILYTDAAGNTWNATDNTADIALNSWYNVAAVSTGTSLKLYKDSGSGYQLVATTDISSSANSRLAYDAAGSSTAGDAAWGWTIGRGRYSTDNAQGAGHTDRWLGYVDEVRISDAALTLDQLLFVPKFSLIAEVTTSGPNAGQVRIKNIDTQAATFNYYLLSSAAGALTKSTWNSLSDQDYDASLPADFNQSGGPVNAADLDAWRGDFAAGGGSDADNDGDSDGDDLLIWQRQLGQSPGPGDSWDEAVLSGPTQLAELFLNSASTLDPGESVVIGKAYDLLAPGAGGSDLTFKYAVPGQALKTAAVVYVPGAMPVPEPHALAMAALLAAGAIARDQRRSLSRSGR